MPTETDRATNPTKEITNILLEGTKDGSVKWRDVRGRRETHFSGKIGIDSYFVKPELQKTREGYCLRMLGHKLSLHSEDYEQLEELGMLAFAQTRPQ